MKVWLDVHLPPKLAAWLKNRFGVHAVHFRDLGLQRAKDLQAFEQGRTESCVIMSKDRDFPDLVRKLGSPPQIIWITCGNTTNAHLQLVLETEFPRAVLALKQGASLVEIQDSLRETL